MLADYSEKIEKNRPKVTKSASGYQVWDILSRDRLNLASLFVGSEGTLGVFTEAELKIVPLSKERGIISGKTPATIIDDKHFFKIMDYCLNCGQCLTDCPTSVDIPGMTVLAKEKLHQKQPYKINEKILQNGRLVSKIASLTALLTNWILSLSFIRYMMELFTGIDKRRDFPKFKKYTIAKSAEEKTITPNEKKVVLWSGCSAQYNDPEGEFTDIFSSVPIRIIYHDPCHLKSQQNDYGPKDLLSLIPDLELIEIDDSCCGIAGTFGMKKENYDLSMKIGNPLFSQINEAIPDRLVSGCGTCQIQLQNGTDIETIHPIVLLYQSYVKKETNLDNSKKIMFF